MRIAMISTPFIPVPPPRYGGTELVVAELAEGLLERGHDVTLFGTGDSRTRAKLRARHTTAFWPPDPLVELDHVAWALEAVMTSAARFDVIHSHCGAGVPLARFVDVPMVYTVHHGREEKMARLYAGSRAHLVAISTRQRELSPELANAQVIHHGLSPSAYPLGDGDGGYVLFLGRFAQEKGVHLAIEAARQAGVPIGLAGAPHWKDQDYYEEKVEPLLGQPGVVELGEVGGRRKTTLLQGGRALLFPVEWEEPFGLAMIEAMLSGTPVLGFPRGAVPEVIDEGVTGFLCADAGEMAARLKTLDGFDRRRCRRRAVERFSSACMVEAYESLYRQVIWKSGHARESAPVA